MSDIDSLIEAFFSGELDAEGAAELRAWLAEDKDRMEVFILRSRSEVALQRVYEMRRIQGIRTSFLFTELLEDAELHEVDPVDITHIVDSAHQTESDQRRRVRAPGMTARNAAQDAGRGPRVIVIPTFIAYSALAAAVVAVAGLIWAFVGDKTTGPQLAEPEAPPLAPVEVEVATVIDRAGGAEEAGPLIGQTLSSGESLSIRSGMVKLQTPQGASLVIEGPARLVAMGKGRVRLEEGRVVARCEPEGSQIAIDAGDLRVIDLGTEFAVLRVPGQPVSVHVFDGEVAASTPDATGESDHQQHLTVGQAVSYEPDSGAFIPQPVGWSEFVRDFQTSAGPLELPSYVLAYWRFEENTPGTHAGEAMDEIRKRLGITSEVAAVDASGRGNHLYTAPDLARPRFGGRVGERSIPGTGAVNRGVLDDTGQADPNIIRNLHTRHAASNPRVPLYNHAFEQWTVEFSVMFEKLEGLQSVVSFTTDTYQRDVVRLGAEGDRFYAGAENRMGDWNDVRVDAVRLRAGQWYHVAVTNDGEHMRVWLCEQGSRAYHEVAATPVEGVFIHEAVPAGIAEWTLGGEGDLHDAFCLIDEVRVSARALSPDQMLFSRPAAQAARQGVRP